MSVPCESGRRRNGDGRWAHAVFIITRLSSATGACAAASARQARLAVVCAWDLWFGPFRATFALGADGPRN
eukprot:1097702-Pleurochrysis_carterae.AAC.23